MKHTFLFVVFVSNFAMAIQEDEHIALRRSVMQLHHSQSMHEVGKSKRTFLAFTAGAIVNTIALLLSIKRPYHLGRKIWTGMLGAASLGLSLKTYQSYNAKKVSEHRANRYKMAINDDDLAQELLQEKLAHE